MATKNATARARMEDVKTDLRSISTCTESTVAELRDLLAVDTNDSAEKENVRGSRAQSNKAQAAKAGKTASATARTAAGTTTKAVTLSTPRERYILATEVANITLKSLSDALKSHRPLKTAKSKPPSPTEPALSGTPRRTFSRSSSLTQKPLQERSVPQTTNSPRKPTTLRRSLSYSSCLTTGPDPGLVATAECARIAFAYLRSAEAAKIAGKDAPALQVESGILALIGKLVAHGQDGLAVKELRMLKKRLEQFLLPSNGRILKKGAAAPKATVAQEKESLASLLEFGDFDLTSPTLPLIVSLQTYALRLMARLRRARLVEEAWTYLKLSNPSSPANLICHMAKVSNADPKTLRQLENLAQSVLALCPSISRSEDASLDQKHLQPPPDVVLSLQHLAFKIRQRWWKLANHVTNEEKELLEPFTKCMITFARRSELSAVKKYKVAELLFTDLVGSSEHLATLQKRGKSSAAALAANTLSSLAQSANLPAEALRWLGKSGSSALREESAAAAATRLVQGAVLSLGVYLNDPDQGGPDPAISDALNALSGNLGGSHSELDSLFMQASALRRTAAKALSKNNLGLASGPQLQTLALNCISAAVRFTARYLGTSVASDLEPRHQPRYKQRTQFLANYVKSILDSACMCCKIPVGSDREPHWVIVDTMLHDCISILKHFDNATNDEIEGAHDLQHAFAKVSNAYWALHLQLKTPNGTDKLSLRAMQRSAEILRSRPLSEQHAGLLTMKLERLAEALESRGDASASRKAIVQCIETLTEFGVLRNAGALAQTLPLQCVFESDESTTGLARAIKWYQRSFLKFGTDDSSELAIYDNPQLGPTERGLLLEYQLHLYAKILSKNRVWDTSLGASLQALSQRLREIYAPETFPIRRQRALLVLFRLSQERPDLLHQHEFANLEDVMEIDVQGTEDEGLERFCSHFTALWKLKLCLQDSSSYSSTIKECVLIWQALLSSSSSWKDLSERVDDVELWLTDLQAASDYLTVKGEEYYAVQLQYLISRILELENAVDRSRLVKNTSHLALQLLRLGYTGKAGLLFAKTEKMASDVMTSTEARLQWHLGYAEYLLQLGNPVKCETSLTAAETIARQDSGFMSLADPSTTLSGRTRFNRILADACYVHSLLAFHTGHHQDAARRVRQCVALNRRIWAALENKQTSTSPVAPSGSDTEGDKTVMVSFDPLSTMRNDKGIPLVMSVTHGSLDGPSFWPLVPRLYHGLMLQSHIYAHQGLLQEAVYIAEQAEMVASAVNARSLIVDNASRRAEYWVQGGRTDKAQSALAVPEKCLRENHIFMAAYHSSMARIRHANEEFDEELSAYERLEGLLSGLSSPSFIEEMVGSSANMDSLTTQMAAVSLEASEPAKKPTTRAPRGRKPGAPTARKTTARAPRKAPVKNVQTTPTPPTSIGDECLSLCRLQADIARRRALVNLLQEDVSKALELLSQAQLIERGAEKSVSHAWLSFKASLSRGMQQLATDLTFNTLPESTIAFPAVRDRDRKNSGIVSTKRTIAATATTRGGRVKKSVKEDFIASLREARDRLLESHNLCAQIGSAASFQQASFALASVTVLLSAVSNEDAQGALHPLYAAYMSEIPRTRSLKHAQAIVQVEQEKLSRDEYLAWPALIISEREQLSAASDFQREYIDIIPKNWTAISLSLNEDHDELYITRYDAGQSPFVIRLPMARHASRDLDEVEFTFDDGKKDFEEIIELSDFSTRTAKDMTTKEKRLQWWTEREALDTRLHELLLNIENIWLGGFKGVFSQHSREPTLMARFRKSFEATLNKHLPSRQGKGAQAHPALDPRVLDLFIGLGDATDENLDLDEALMDLIYFVVDILQFNGERNAYDEIDFDSMVIETLDALRAYHRACHGAAPDKTHTILILDKSLHTFPWESLPCLQKLAISRLPSLQALRERLLAARSPTTIDDAEPGHYISTTAGGTSILNPSGDLTHTLKTLKPRLDSLSGPWTHITNRPPSESEFESALRTNDLLLYFGHGSGAQFVKSKAVRRLYPGPDATKPGCATALLFGCSSVHLTTNGVYEPSGMLASYLTAGAPAVVGMLWDVTDKDCDRLAVRAGELWGLWEEVREEEAPKTAAKKGRGKGRMVEEEVEGARAASGKARSRSRCERVKGDKRSEVGEDGEKGRKKGVGLDEAVRQAREACVMRYLNGAAAVVYGVPVFLG
ncbi:uncharacterized protein EI97DRAFT_399489 [Westerdykella ornata]|uniref:separase n=1 Tax=Westerdykella ornata TaxID=318751 RepID=A0A6A6JH84_WESOR|nr:uncharacterized protein EI97DRAFT_399489 [Westerdykella ornata]KAF2275921.1 hypothetical protein EI97DRAFT_399489 [Westerdykella ornata]